MLSGNFGLRYAHYNLKCRIEARNFWRVRLLVIWELPESQLTSTPFLRTYSDFVSVSNPY
jgi:hypothetical protein